MSNGQTFRVILCWYCVFVLIIPRHVAVTYPPTDIACGSSRPQIFTNHTGVFASPGFPLSYPSSVNCKWLITVNQTVSLDFPTCIIGERGYDFIYVYNDSTCSTGTRNLIAIITGNYTTRPPTVHNEHGDLCVWFSTDTSDTFMGFEGRWTNESACYRSRELADGQGWFASPFYPETYLANKTCEWTVPSNKTAVLTFTAFNVGVRDAVSGNCQFDFVDVIENNAPTHRLCGSTLPDPLTVDSVQSASIVFHSDPDREPQFGQSFSVAYTIRDRQAIEETTEDDVKLTTINIRANERTTEDDVKLTTINIRANERTTEDDVKLTTTNIRSNETTTTDGVTPTPSDTISTEISFASWLLPLACILLHTR